MAKWYKNLSKFVQETDNYVKLSDSINFGNAIGRQYKKLKSTVKVTGSTSQNVEVKRSKELHMFPILVLHSNFRLKWVKKSISIWEYPNLA